MWWTITILCVLLIFVKPNALNYRLHGFWEERLRLSSDCARQPGEVSELPGLAGQVWRGHECQAEINSFLVLCEDSVSKQRNEMSFSTGCMRREPTATATYELKMNSGKEQCFAILIKIRIKNAGEMRGGCTYQPDQYAMNWSLTINL